MNTKKFNTDFDYYRSNLLQIHDSKTVNLMLLSYCMGYCELSNHVYEEFDSFINLDPVLEKITELSKSINEKS